MTGPAVAYPTTGGHDGIGYGRMRATVFRDGEVMHDVAWADREPNDVLIAVTHPPASRFARTVGDGFARDAAMHRTLGGERYMTAKPNLYEVRFDSPRVLGVPGSDGRIPSPCWRCAMAGVVGGVQHVTFPLAELPSCLNAVVSPLPRAEYGMVPCFACSGTGLTWGRP